MLIEEIFGFVAVKVDFSRSEQVFGAKIENNLQNGTC